MCPEISANSCVDFIFLIMFFFFFFFFFFEYYMRPTLNVCIYRAVTTLNEIKPYNIDQKIFYINAKDIFILKYLS